MMIFKLKKKLPRQNLLKQKKKKPINKKSYFQISLITLNYDRCHKQNVRMCLRSVVDVS